ncbi:hypothetical protein GCM10023354_03300 [Garicola koreensis]
MTRDVKAIAGVFAWTVFRRDLRPMKGIISAGDTIEPLTVEVPGVRGLKVFRQH